VNSPDSHGCTPKPALVERALISEDLSGRLAEFFKVLGNNTRLRMLHAIAKHSELSVSAIAAAVGMKAAAVSNQLQQLNHRGIVRTRRDGNTIFYRIVDPCVLELLDRGLCLIEDAEESAFHRSHESNHLQLLASSR
jgi:DNA-binding transcriptional ArsR family regulator